MQLLFFSLVLRGLSTGIHSSNGLLLLTGYPFCYFLVKQSLMSKDNQALEVSVTSQWPLLFPDPFMRSLCRADTCEPLRSTAEKLREPWCIFYHLSRHGQTFNPTKEWRHPQSACLRASQLSYRRKKKFSRPIMFLGSFVLGYTSYLLSLTAWDSIWSGGHRLEMPAKV